MGLWNMKKLPIEQIKEKLNGQVQVRELQGTVERALIDKEKRIIPLSVSSEAPIMDWYGFGILDHNVNSIRMERFLKGAAVRDTHYGDQIGKVTNPTIDSAEKKLRVDALFSKNGERAELIYNDIIDEIRENVSLRFLIHDMVLEREVDGVPYYRITDWEPVHVSIEIDPADVSVGVGRDANGNTNIIPIDSSKDLSTQINEINKNQRNVQIILTNNRGATMGEQSTPKPAETQERQMSESEVAVLKEQLKNNLKEEHQRAIDAAHKNGGKDAMLNVASILRAAKDFKEQVKGVDLDAKAEEFMKLGANERQFKDFILNHMVSNQNSTPQDFELNQRDQNRFSLSKVLMSLDPSSGVKADFERGICREYSEQTNQDSKNGGIVLPTSVLLSQRTLQAGTGTGANIVLSQPMPQQFIDIVRNKTVADKIGVKFMAGLVGTPVIPKKTSAVAGGWMTDETSAPSTTDMVLGQKTLSPHTYSASLGVSRLLSLQGTPDADMLAQDDLVKTVATVVDSSILNGTGLSGQPTGVVATSGVGLGTAKASITNADIIALETAIADSNLDAETMAYITNPTIRGILKGRLKDAGIAGKIWENNEMNGYKGIATKQAASGYLFFGDGSQIVVGQWGGLDIAIDPISSKAGIVYYTVYISIDVMLRYPAAMAFYTGVN